MIWSTSRRATSTRVETCLRSLTAIYLRSINLIAISSYFSSCRRPVGKFPYRDINSTSRLASRTSTPSISISRDATCVNFSVRASSFLESWISAHFLILFTAVSHDLQMHFVFYVRYCGTECHKLNHTITARFRLFWFFLSLGKNFPSHSRSPVCFKAC